MTLDKQIDEIRDSWGEVSEYCQDQIMEAVNTFVEKKIKRCIGKDREQEHFGFIEGMDLDEMYELADKFDVKHIALIDGYNQRGKEIRERMNK